MARVVHIAEGLTALKAHFEAVLKKTNYPVSFGIIEKIIELTEVCQRNMRRDVEKLQTFLEFMNFSFEELKSICETIICDNTAQKKENAALLQPSCLTQGDRLAGVQLIWLTNPEPGGTKK